MKNHSALRRLGAFALIVLVVSIIHNPNSPDIYITLISCLQNTAILHYTFSFPINQEAHLLNYYKLLQNPAKKYKNRWIFKKSGCIIVKYF